MWSSVLFGHVTGCSRICGLRTKQRFLTVIQCTIDERGAELPCGSHMNNGDVAVSYVLVPFFLITIIGIAAAVVMYIRKKRRIDRLRHQLLPVYTYDPSEELNEVEQEMLWREEDTRLTHIPYLPLELQKPLVVHVPQF
ncbi:hypothetical protein LDENG_00084340 [Lucifuga dentata]|nr:hypothetical protein LDENG_00084340 [Lucifuga dentata]